MSETGRPPPCRRSGRGRALPRVARPTQDKERGVHAAMSDSHRVRRSQVTRLVSGPLPARANPAVQRNPRAHRRRTPTTLTRVTSRQRRRRAPRRSMRRTVRPSRHALLATPLATPLRSPRHDHPRRRQCPPPRSLETRTDDFQQTPRSGREGVGRGWPPASPASWVRRCWTPCRTALDDFLVGSGCRWDHGAAPSAGRAVTGWRVAWVA